MIKKSLALIERLSSRLHYHLRFEVLRCPVFFTQLFVGMNWAKDGCSYPSFFLPASAALMLELTLLSVIQTLRGWGRLTKLVSVDFCVLNMHYGLVKCYL